MELYRGYVFENFFLFEWYVVLLSNYCIVKNVVKNVSSFGNSNVDRIEFIVNCNNGKSSGIMNKIFNYDKFLVFVFNIFY